LESELNETYNVKEELGNRLECSREEARAWKEMASERKAKADQLKRCVRRFDGVFTPCTRRTNFGVCRFDGRLSRAVENATEAEKVSSNVLEIKDEHGVIEDRFREAIADLTGVCGVSAKSSFDVFKKCATWAGKEVKGSWDRRTVPRVMHEVAQAAEVLVTERFLESIGSSSTGWLCNKIGWLTLICRIVSERRWRFT
jgi:hypothetical protein